MNSKSRTELIEGAINSFGDLFYVFRPSGTIVEWNEQFTNVLGYSEDEIRDLNPAALVGDTEQEEINKALESVTEDSEIVTFSTILETKTGNRIPYEFQWAPLENSERSETEVASLGREITESQRQRDDQFAKPYETQKLTVPIVEVWDGILLSTVIGKLSAAQAETFTEELLELIAESDASVAIIDITGAEAVDTQTGQHLIDTIRAVKLMGGQTIITGLDPDTSQTLVKLGIGFDVETRSSLQDGLKTAFELQGVSID